MKTSSDFHINISGFDQFTRLTKDSTSTYLLVFSTKWSGSSSILIEALKEHTDPLTPQIDQVLYIDFEKNKNLADQFGVREVPTTVIVKNNEALNFLTGLYSLEELNNTIKEKEKKQNS